MSEKELSSPLDAALAHVAPDRRKFLGMLLTGVAAAPLLNSAVLAAEDKAHFPKAEIKSSDHKTATSIKDGATIKGSQSNSIKLNDQKTQSIKYWDKNGASNAQTIKSNNSTIKLNSGTAIKGENSAIKHNNTDTIKLTNAGPIKGNSSTIKNSTGASSTIK
jgi:hypothetical protein